MTNGGVGCAGSDRRTGRALGDGEERALAALSGRAISLACARPSRSEATLVAASDVGSRSVDAPPSLGRSETSKASDAVSRHVTTAARGNAAQEPGGWA